MNRKPVIIKITKYDKDPSRVGHELEISSHIIGSVKPKKQVKQKTNKPKQPSTRDILLQFIAKQEQFNEEVRQFMVRQDKINKLNNLKTE
ncbi:MAG: hypothetical protein LBQ45_01675 [Mycoplasmataceae bacterium]|jgi:hypothetical protein|nr:hypothetical protein [Mycoplasmataceae bacterium]